MPNFDLDTRRSWNEVFIDLENGILHTPYATILREAVRVFGDHPVLRPLAERHGLVKRGRPSFASDPIRPSSERLSEEASSRSEGCHVLVRADNEDDRQHAVSQLRELGLDPEEVWSTGAAVSYRLTVSDPGVVRKQLEQFNLGWTIVAPGEPDYLYSRLIVEGPDTRRYVVHDAPAGQTVGNLANEILSDHDSRPEATVPIVIDHIAKDDVVQRVDSDTTMHEAGIRDGDTVRIGYQTTAGGGGVYIVEREAALELAATHTFHPDRGGRLSILASALLRRFEHTGDPATLDEAIEVSRQSVIVNPADYPNAGAYPFNLSITPPFASAITGASTRTHGAN